MLLYCNSEQLHEGQKKKKLLLDLTEQSLQDISEMSECEIKEKCRRPFYFRKQQHGYWTKAHFFLSFYPDPDIFSTPCSVETQHALVTIPSGTSLSLCQLTPSQKGGGRRTCDQPDFYTVKSHAVSCYVLGLSEFHNKILKFCASCTTKTNQLPARPQQPPVWRAQNFQWANKDHRCLWITSGDDVSKEYCIFLVCCFVFL